MPLKAFATQPQMVSPNWTVFHTTSNLDAESIRCLVEALVTADKAVASDIEAQLVKLGQVALPFVLDGLRSAYPLQQATCAMVLLRWQAVQPLRQWAIEHPSLAWIAEQLLAMLPVSAVEKQDSLRLVAA